MGASLASGYLEHCTVACPWHAWRFDIRDGSWCDNPRVKIDSYPVEARAGAIYVQVPDSES
jgi:nitrite reductase (NADH) small subunit/3-phenylpropionate/trans-cinnamate dioxygenase ferredoxin subunit